jgi:hypothetical protein
MRWKRRSDGGLWWGILREGDHLEDSGVVGIVILKCISGTWDGVMD